MSNATKKFEGLDMAEDEEKEEKKEETMFPIRVPNTLIVVMDAFLAKHPELGIFSRQELARRAIADWVLQMKERLKSLEK